MSRRADELRDGIERAQERRRIAFKQLERYLAFAGDSEPELRTRRKLEESVTLADNDIEILGRALKHDHHGDKHDVFS